MQPLPHTYVKGLAGAGDSSRVPALRPPLESEGARLITGHHFVRELPLFYHEQK